MFKVITWNVNSITQRLERAMALLERHQPDVLCLQELKCIDEKFPFEAFQKAGYHATVFGQKTYNGVAIISKSPPESPVRGFQDDVEDPAARFLTANIQGVTVVCAYFPNGQEVGSPAYAYKLEWYNRLRRYLDKHVSPKQNAVVVGDFNVAPEDRDVHDPAAWRGQILFSDPERAALRSLMEFGLVDTFRLHHSQAGFYSWWDYRNLAFPFNKGLRIDFVLASPPLAERCRASSIDREERKGTKPSDHAPVVAEFEL